MARQSGPRDRTPLQRRPPRSAARRKRDRRRELQRLQAAPARGLRRSWLAAGAGAVVVLAVVLAIVLTRGHGTSSATTTTTATATPAPTATPQPLASVSTDATGATIDGIQCGSSETTTNRTTAHLAVYADGSARGIPAGVGIAPPLQTISTGAGPFVQGKCYYAVLTHTADGVVNIEPSTKGTTYTLGQLFDVWGQPLSASQAGPAMGTLTVYVNGTPFTGDPRTVTLAAHAVIQIDVGTQVPFQPYTFPPGD